jgi:hypothetical protein
MKHSSDKSNRLRQLIAQEAAKHIADSGRRDFAKAKRRAAERLGVSASGALPSNQEIERALAEHHRTFVPVEQEQMLEAMRGAALGLMEDLEMFSPLLAGPVLAGVVDRHSIIELHLLAEPFELVGDALRGLGIPHKLSKTRVRTGRADRTEVPIYLTECDGVAADLVVFTLKGHRDPPRSPVDGKPMKRASINRVRELRTTAGA